MEPTTRRRALQNEDYDNLNELFLKLKEHDERDSKESNVNSSDVDAGIESDCDEVGIKPILIMNLFSSKIIAKYPTSPYC